MLFQLKRLTRSPQNIELKFISTFPGLKTLNQVFH